jgi:lipase maturation factor 1
MARGARMNARGRVIVLFRAGLGLVFLAAFLSLAVQLRDLVGTSGLLPWAGLLARLGASPAGRLENVLSLPTLFLWIHGDAAFLIVPLLGAAISILLILGIGGRAVPLVLWLLYLSCITAGRDFFYYQWDNLLLEASFLTIFLPGRGTLLDLVRRRPLPEPQPLALFLVNWLLFRLLFESGLAKLAAGKDTWLNLSAMTYYYETAPLPSWGGWLVQQFPLWFHHFSVYFTFFVELPLALLIFLPRRFRLLFFAIHLPFQISIGLTSNYGFFNLLTIVLSLACLCDRDLDAALRFAERMLRLGRPGAAGGPAPVAEEVAAPAGGRRRVLLGRVCVWVLAFLIVPASIVEALGYFEPSMVQDVARVRALYAPFRSVNVYHLFPGILRERIVAEIEGTPDGVEWKPYHLRYAPGDPRDPPPTTFLHNPRFPFHYSFWTLGRGRRDEEYIGNLARRLCCDPAAVASLFKDDPFPSSGPQALRIVHYRYRFGRRADLTLGNYWLREQVGEPTRPYTCSCAPGP